MKKSRRQPAPAPPAPVGVDWRDLAASAWAVAVLVAFLAVLGATGVLTFLGQMLESLGG